MSEELGQHDASSAHRLTDQIIWSNSNRSFNVKKMSQISKFTDKSTSILFFSFDLQCKCIAFALQIRQNTDRWGFII
jgi:hypothetical protein